MLIGLIPFMISEIYSTNLREAKQTLIPMVANIIAVFINLILNYIFIFGKFGAPALGVVGAAIGTVVARIVCCLIVMIYAHSSKKYRFNSEVFKKLLPSKESFITIFKKSYILLINEFLWSLGMMLINYCYSFRGLEVVAAVNISSMFVNLFALIGTSYGNGISVLLGQQLGARDFEEAKISSYRYLTFSVILGFVVAFIMYCLRATVPTLYEMSDKIIFMSEDLIAITALLLPIRVYSTACYFTIRSGGKLFITFLFDSVFTLCIRVLITYIVVKTTNLSIYYVYFISEILEVIKIVIGTILVKKGIWIQSVSN
jgi:putative MATE family efflux protein